MNDTDHGDFDALGSQYREAMASIGVHRRRQAAAEVAYAAVFHRHGGDRAAPDVVAALEVLDRAVADVQWCKAVTVAAGEAFKGVSFEDVVANNEANRAEHSAAALRERALSHLEASA